MQKIGFLLGWIIHSLTFRSLEKEFFLSFAYLFFSFNALYRDQGTMSTDYFWPPCLEISIDGLHNMQNSCRLKIRGVIYGIFFCRFILCKK
jgi:hypothetical protein